MKRFFLIVITVVLMLFHIPIIYAHPGRLDENGGHWNRSTNTYHYHNATNTDTKLNSKEISDSKDLHTSDISNNSAKSKSITASIFDFFNVTKQTRIAIYEDANKENEIEISFARRIMDNIFILFGVFYYLHIVGLFIKSIVEENPRFKRIADSFMYKALKSIFKIVFFPVFLVIIIDHYIAKNLKKNEKNTKYYNLEFELEKFSYNTVYLGIALLLPLFFLMIYQHEHPSFSAYYSLNIAFGRFFIAAVFAYLFALASIKLDHDTLLFYIFGILFIIISFVMIFLPVAILFLISGSKSAEWRIVSKNKPDISLSCD